MQFLAFGFLFMIAIRSLKIYIMSIDMINVDGSVTKPCMPLYDDICIVHVSYKLHLVKACLMGNPYIAHKDLTCRRFYGYPNG